MLARLSYRARWVVAAVLGLAFLLVFVFPTRSLLAQRTELGDAKRELEIIDEQNRRLELQRQRLQTADEIEELARALYLMIWPGETPYVVVPPATDATTGPSGNPSAPTTTAP